MWLSALFRGLLARKSPRDDIAPDRVSRAGLLVWAPVFMALGIGCWFSLTFEPGLVLYALVAAATVVISAWS